MATDDQLAAHKKEEITTVVEEITNLPVCMFCFTEAPSAHVRTEKMCIESWRYVRGKLHCSFCGASARGDGHSEHMEQIRQSLRRRVGWQLDQALSRVPESEVKQKK